MKVESFRDLVAWQKAMDRAIACYQISRSFPREEQFGLTSQLRRAAVSVPANIAEGKGRGFSRAFVNHLSISGGSLCELDTHLELAVRLQYIPNETLAEIVPQIEQVGRLVTGLRKSVEATMS
jgi:four helix bundle protein